MLKIQFNTSFTASIIIYYLFKKFISEKYQNYRINKIGNTSI